MTGPELRAWRATHNLTTRAAGRLLGFSSAAISRWENGSRAMPRHFEIDLREIEKQLKKQKKRA